MVLAQKTGGLFYAGNDIASSIRRAVDDGNGYYLWATSLPRPRSMKKQGLRISQHQFESEAVGPIRTVTYGFLRYAGH